MIASGGRVSSSADHPASQVLQRHSAFRSAAARVGAATGRRGDGLRGTSAQSLKKGVKYMTAEAEAVAAMKDALDAIERALERASRAGLGAVVCAALEDAQISAGMALDAAEGR